MRTTLVFLLLAASLPAQQEERKAIIRGIRDYAKQGIGSISRIEPYLQDKDEEVRWEAVQAIASLGTQRSLDPLLAATRDTSPEIQIRAIDGLVNFYLPGYLKTGLTASIKRTATSLKGRFTDTNSDVIDPGVTVRADVIEALGAVVAGGSAMEARATAARGLGILRGQAALESLYAGLRSKNTYVLYESLTAIQKIRDPASAPKIQFLLRDLDDRVQIAAVETVGILRHRDSLPALRDVLENDKERKVKRAALTAIAMIPDESSRPLYERFLQDTDDGLRGAAAEGYGRLKVASDLPAIEKAFEEEKKTNARLSLAFACVALGKHELSEFSPLQYLVNTLNSKLWRDSAEPLLAELTRDPEVGRRLYPVILDREATREEKIRLARIFGTVGSQEAGPAIEKLKNDPDAEVAQEAARAARNLAARLP